MLSQHAAECRALTQLLRRRRAGKPHDGGVRQHPVDAGWRCGGKSLLPVQPHSMQGLLSTHLHVWCL